MAGLSKFQEAGVLIRMGLRPGDCKLHRLHATWSDGWAAWLLPSQPCMSRGQTPPPSLQHSHLGSLPCSPLSPSPPPPQLHVPPTALLPLLLWLHNMNSLAPSLAHTHHGIVTLSCYAPMPTGLEAGSRSQRKEEEPKQPGCCSRSNWSGVEAGQKPMGPIITLQDHMRLLQEQPCNVP